MVDYGPCIVVSYGFVVPIVAVVEGVADIVAAVAIVVVETAR